MPSINDIYGSDSDRLKADDLRAPDGSFRVVQATIESIEVVNFAKDDDPKPQHKLVLNLVGKDKSVVLNQTNAANLGSRYGIDYSNWTGKDVLITGSMKKFKGQTVPGIDVTAPLVPEAQQAQEYAAAAAPTPVGQDFDEDIPF